MQMSSGNWLKVSSEPATSRAHAGQARSAPRKSARRQEKAHALAMKAAWLGVSVEEVVMRAALECEGFRAQWRGKPASIDSGRSRHSWWD